MDLRWFIVLALLVLGHLYKLVLHIVQQRSAGNPTPKNVADVYDAETYEKWRRYSGEQSRLGIISCLASFALEVALLVSGAYAWAASCFPAGWFWQAMAVILLSTVCETVIGVFISYYDTMVIEEKYGFNRSTMKTFVTDQIRNLLIGLVLNTLLVSLLALIWIWLGNWMLLLFTGVVFCITLLITFLYPIFSRMGNKFEPLEEGELKDKLMALLTKHGYQVKAIEVMDASRRTTKLNAYFTGFGKMKTIVLYDNLVNAMSTDEICAVFAHELGHGLYKDVLKQQIMNLGNLFLMALVAWVAVRSDDLHTIFGFSQVNFGFANILIGIGLGLIQPLTGMAMSAYSRFAEYRADRQAVKEGYGPMLVTALKKLARENFAHLAPARLLVVLEYSHPPLSQRIEAVEKALEETK